MGSPALYDCAEVGGEVATDGEVAALEAHPICVGRPVEFAPTPLRVDGVGEEAGDFRRQLTTEGRCHDGGASGDFVHLPFDVGGDNDRCLQEAEFVEETLQHVHGDLPVRLATNGLPPDDEAHGRKRQARERVHYESATGSEAVHWTEGLPGSFAGEVRQSGQHLVELVVLGAGRVLQLREGFKAQAVDQLRHLEHVVEGWRSGGKVGPMHLVGVRVPDGLLAVLGEEDEDLEPRVDKGSDGVGFARARLPHEEDLGAGDGTGFGGVSHGAYL